MLKVGLLSFGGLASACFGSVALGIGDAHQLELYSTWVSLLAGVACLARSPIHVVWGHYLTRHPDKDDKPRRELIELNLLVPVNVLLSSAWIWIAAAQLGQPAPQPPLAFALGLPTAVLLAGIETVRCVKATGKKRGTEIVCEGPVGEWFRELFDASYPGVGYLHKVMEFFRYPNSATWVSGFLCLLAALMFVPVPVHTSAAAAGRVRDAVFPSTQSISHGEVRRGKSSAAADGDDNLGADSTFEEQCGGPYEAKPAPTRNREQIEGLFEEAGASQAGCPTAAESVAKQPGVWVAPAYCGSELRSIVVTNPGSGYLPALLYQQAAAFALARGHDGTLRGASSRHPLRGGDFYLIDTSLGSFVLIRSHSSAKQLSSRHSEGLACEEYNDRNVNYTVVPPSLVDLWLELVAKEGWLWPQSSGADGEGLRFEFFTERPAHERVATASCASDLSCTLRIGDQKRSGLSRASYASVSEIMSLGG